MGRLIHDVESKRVVLRVAASQGDKRRRVFVCGYILGIGHRGHRCATDPGKGENEGVGRSQCRSVSSIGLTEGKGLCSNRGKGCKSFRLRSRSSVEGPEFLF